MILRVHNDKIFFQYYIFFVYKFRQVRKNGQQKRTGNNSCPFCHLCSITDIRNFFTASTIFEPTWFQQFLTHNAVEQSRQNTAYNQVWHIPRKKSIHYDWSGCQLPDVMKNSARYADIYDMFRKELFAYHHDGKTQ